MFALLRRLDLFLDVVAAVGRTVEEEALPVLLPAAGQPRDLFRECIARAAVASGGVSAEPVHSASSLRFLRLAAGMMLLVQEYAWRVRVSAASSASASSPVSLARTVVSIVNENLDDARSLLRTVGLRDDLVTSLCGEPVSLASSPASLPSGSDGSAAAHAGLPSSSSTSSASALLSPRQRLSIESTIARVADGDAATGPALLHLVQSTHDYCARLRSAALDHVAAARRAEEEVQRAREAAQAEELARREAEAAAAAAAAEEARRRREAEEAAAAASRGSGWFGWLGFGGGGDAPAPAPASAVGLQAAPAPAVDSDSVPAGDLALSAPVGTDADAHADAGPDSVLTLLRDTTVQLLTSVDAPIQRTGPAGSFGLLIAPVIHAQAARGSDYRTSDQVLAALPGPHTEDAMAVAGTLAQVDGLQQSWLVAQLRDASACISGFTDPTPPSALASSADQHLAVGDVVASVDGRSLSGDDFDGVMDALAAAPKRTRVVAWRVVSVPALAIMADLLAQAQGGAATATASASGFTAL